MSYASMSHRLGCRWCLSRIGHHHTFFPLNNACSSIHTLQPKRTTKHVSLPVCYVRY